MQGDSNMIPNIILRVRHHLPHFHLVFIRSQDQLIAERKQRQRKDLNLLTHVSHVRRVAVLLWPLLSLLPHLLLLCVRLWAWQKHLRRINSSSTAYIYLVSLVCVQYVISSAILLCPLFTWVTPLWLLSTLLACLPAAPLISSTSASSTVSTSCLHCLHLGPRI